MLNALKRFSFVKWYFSLWEEAIKQAKEQSGEILDDQAIEQIDRCARYRRQRYTAWLGYDITKDEFDRAYQRAERQYRRNSANSAC